MTRTSRTSKIRISTSSVFRISNQTFLVPALKAIVLAAAVVAFYFQDLILAFTNAVNDETTSYILIIPIVFTYLIYRKRRMLLAAITDTKQNLRIHTEYYSIPSGILLCLTAIILYWHGSYTFAPLEYHLATVPIFTAGLTLILFNPQMLRQALFPIAFLIFLMPPTSEIFYNIGSLLSVFALAVFITYIVRDSAWKKAVVFAIGFPLIYILNIIRTTAIIAVGYSMGEQFALDVFRLMGGWVFILIVTILVLAIGERILRIDLFSNRRKQTCPDCNGRNTPIETRDYCAHCGRILAYATTKVNTKDAARLAITIAAILLLLWIQMPVLATTHGPPSVMISTGDSEQGNTQLFPQINDYNIQYLSRDPTVENTSKLDYRIFFKYTNTSENNPPVGITLEIANTTSALRRWETALARVSTQLVLEDVQILDNPSIMARYFAFQYRTSNLAQLVLYWYDTSTFTINNVIQQKHVELSLYITQITPQDIPDMESRLLPIAEEIAKYWQPIKRSLFVSILISQHGLELGAATITGLTILVALYIFDVRRQKKASLNVYQKLGTKEQQLVTTVREIQKTGIPTLYRITETYNKNSGAMLTTEQLQQKLVDLQKTNVIQSVTRSDRDEPVKTWKA